KKRLTGVRMPARVPIRQRRVRRPGPRTAAMRVDLPSPMTTRFTRAVTSIAEIEALERMPYDSLVPARNLYHLFDATARLHPHRAELTLLVPPGEVSITHRQLLGEISRAANLFKSSEIAPDGPTVSILSPIQPQIFPALLGAQVAGVASSINYLLNEDTIVDLLEAQNATVLVISSQ